VYQRTVEYPDEFNNGHLVMLDTGVLVTVRWGQVKILITPFSTAVVIFPAAAQWAVSNTRGDS